MPIKLRATVAAQRSSGVLYRVTPALTASYRVPVKARLLIYKSSLALCVKNVKGQTFFLKEIIQEAFLELGLALCLKMLHRTGVSPVWLKASSITSSRVTSISLVTL